MKNLLTKILFILSLSSAVVPSGVQAAFSTAAGKKFAKVVLKVGVGTAAEIVVAVAVKLATKPLTNTDHEKEPLSKTRPSKNTINGEGPLSRTK